MQTSFTAEQLQNPEIVEAKAILETCVHYGFCTNTCPTYVLTRNENESPRGRIDLIKEMLEAQTPPKPETVQHLDSCLSCLSCMTTCAVKVDYVHLIDRARVHIEEHYRRPIVDRLLRKLLAAILTRPKMLGIALTLGRGARVMRPLLPSRLRPLVDIIPQQRTSAEYLSPAVYPAGGNRKRRVALLAGCAQQALNADINRSTIRVLQRHGCEVVVVGGSGCCGSLPLHMGKENVARAFARQNVEAWSREIERSRIDAIVVNASGCGTTIKDYGHLFEHDAQMREPAKRIAAIAKDVTEVLLECGLQPDQLAPAYRVAYHDPCSMQHGQKVVRQPRMLLRAVGFTVTDVPEKHFCCGSAGTYNLLQPKMATALGKRKAGHIKRTDPDMIATGNIGCMIQIQNYCDAPVVHTVELLDWATGGPLPRALIGRQLRKPESGATPTKDIGEAAAGAAIW